MEEEETTNGLSVSHSSAPPLHLCCLEEEEVDNTFVTRLTMALVGDARRPLT